MVGFPREMNLKHVLIINGKEYRTQSISGYVYSGSVFKLMVFI